MKDIEAVIFDLDNTLYSFSDIWQEANKSMYYLFNLQEKLSYESFFNIYKKHNKNVLKEIKEKKISSKNLRNARIILTMQDLGIVFTDNDARNYYKKMFVFILEKIKKDNNLIDKLKKLKKNYKIYLLTNGFSKEQRKKLEKLEITNIFDNIYISAETGNSKPNKEAFLQIIKGNNLAIEKTLMVGDSYNFDIQPAKKLGMQTAFIPKKWHLDEVMIFDINEKQYKNIDEVFAYLEN